jgi:hypothetical protein
MRNPIFWLGFPFILGLLWLRHYSWFIELLAYCAVISWIVYGVRGLSKTTPSNTLLSSYARIQVSLYFAVLVVLALSIVVIIGNWGYIIALGVWAGIHFGIRGLVSWITPSKFKETSTSYRSDERPG